MTDARAALAEYQRLMQERERLIVEGVDPRLLIVPLNPDDMPADPTAALAGAINDTIGEATADEAGEVLDALAERGVLLVRNDPERLHQYLHDEGAWGDEGRGDEPWHLRVCEGAIAALSR